SHYVAVKPANIEDRYGEQRQDDRSHDAVALQQACITQSQVERSEETGRQRDQIRCHHDGYLLPARQSQKELTQLHQHHSLHSGRPYTGRLPWSREIRKLLTA